MAKLFPQGAIEGNVQVQEPPVRPGSLAAIDPGMVQITLQVLSGTGAVAIALKGLFSLLEKYFEHKAAPVTVKVGPNTLVLPGNVPANDRRQVTEEFLRKAGRSK